MTKVSIAGMAGALCAGLLISGCQSEKKPAPETEASAREIIPDNIDPDNAAEWTLACTNGQTLIVAFDHARQMVTVRRSDGLAFDLIRKTVSSGYLFSATPVELRGNGKNAKWSAPPVSGTDCTVNQIKPRTQPAA